MPPVTGWHRFTPVLPRQRGHGDVCGVCDSTVDVHAGAVVSRSYRHRLHLITEALVAVGRGVTYTRAAQRARVAAGRDPLLHAGLTNLPLHGFTANQIWCEIVALAADLTAWLQLLGCTDPDDQTARQARRWEPKRLRLRLLATAGRLAVSARRTVLHLAAGGRWTGLVLAILTRLRALPAPSG